MLKSEFETLFYDEKGVDVERSADPVSLPTAILAPHAAHSFVREDLMAAYTSVSGAKPRLIVILSSLHAEPLLEDEGKFLFIPESDGIVVTSREIPFETRDVDGHFSVGKRDCYGREEASIEMQLPFVASLFPSTLVLPIFVRKDIGSRECRILSSLLEKITDREKQTLFIVSANASALEPREEAWRKARNFTLTLESGSAMLDQAHKGLITSCGAAILDAVRRQKWTSGRWTILSASVPSWRGERVSDEPEGSDRQLVWHVSARSQGV